MGQHYLSDPDEQVTTADLIVLLTRELNHLKSLNTAQLRAAEIADVERRIAGLKSGRITRESYPNEVSAEPEPETVPDSDMAAGVLTLAQVANLIANLQAAGSGTTPSDGAGLSTPEVESAPADDGGESGGAGAGASFDAPVDNSSVGTDVAVDSGMSDASADVSAVDSSQGE